MRHSSFGRSELVPQESFEEMLTGGHHNSLGRTVEVTELLLADRARLPDLYDCYFSENEVVRLRVSSVMKRISIAQPSWLVPYIDKFLTEIAAIEQASTQWTLAILFEMLGSSMSAEQLADAKEILKRNLTTWEDWIVLNYSMQTLAAWAQHDDELQEWLLPQLGRRTEDSRKSVAARAKKLLALFPA